MTQPPAQHPSAPHHPALHELQRRQLLKLSAGLAAASSGGSAVASTSASTNNNQGGSPKPPAATGRPGDFDFLRGEWRIQNRRLDPQGVWQQFEGEATVYAILAGIGSVEELRIPSRQFSGMGLRLLDVERKLWADHWVNAKSGVLSPAPAWGSFVDGVGIWDSQEQEGDTLIIDRCIWDQITPQSCRWTQTRSRDGGHSWQDNWVMHWQRR